MQVTHLKVSNFGRFVGTHSWDLGPRTYILGENEAGKTTIHDAIRWVLTGWCRGLDGAGRGIHEIRSVGVKGEPVTVSASVQIGDKVWVVLREWDESGSHFQVDGLSGSSSDQFKGWLEIMGGAPVDLYRMALDGELFYAAGTANVKDLLMSVLPVNLSVDGEIVTLEQVDQRYTEAFALRRELKQALKLVPKQSAPAEVVGDIDGVRARLEVLRAERARLAVESASQGAEDRVLLGQLQRELSLTVGESPNTEALSDAELEAVSVDPVLGSDVVAANGALQRLQDARAALMTKGPQTVDLEALHTHKPAEGCVLHPDVPCLTKAKQFKDVAKKLQGAFNEAIHAHAAAVGEIDANILVAEKALVDAKQVLSRAQDWMQECQRVRARRALMGRVAELAMKAAGESAPVNPEIAVLDERISKGQGILEQKIRLQEQHRAFVESVAKRKELETALEKAESDVEVYGPHGVRVKALADAIDGFVSAVNAALQPFGYVLTVKVDPWDLRVNGVTLDRWSLSQRLRISIAIQCALAQVAGLSLTLVDEVQLLLEAPRKVLGKLLMELPLDQIIVARSYEAASQTPNSPGVTVIRL